MVRLHGEMDIDVRRHFSVVIDSEKRIAEFAGDRRLYVDICATSICPLLLIAAFFRDRVERQDGGLLEGIELPRNAVISRLRRGTAFLRQFGNLRDQAGDASQGGDACQSRLICLGDDIEKIVAQDAQDLLMRRSGAAVITARTPSQGHRRNGGGAEEFNGLMYQPPPAPSTDGAREPLCFLLVIIRPREPP